MNLSACEIFESRFKRRRTQSINDALARADSELTERKLAEEALRAERDQAGRYLNIVEVIIVALDTRAKITLLNRKALAQLRRYIS